MSLEELILNLTKEDLDLINREFAKKENKIPSFSFSNMKDGVLEKLVDIKDNTDETIFNSWFNNNINLDNETTIFLENLINNEKRYIKFYNEEDLKINFIAPILNKINFKNMDRDVRAFYEEKITYKTDNFVFTGVTDFLVSKGFKHPKLPYFFIQEFKKGRDSYDPEPQLLAELISGLELNSWKFIKGAYIIGAIWNFVILEKLGKDKYQYFVSSNFDSTKLEDLKCIYKNLIFVKNEIFEIVKNEK